MTSEVSKVLPTITEDTVYSYLKIAYRTKHEKIKAALLEQKKDLIKDLSQALYNLCNELFDLVFDQLCDCLNALEDLYKTEIQLRIVGVSNFLDNYENCGETTPTFKYLVRSFNVTDSSITVVVGIQFWTSKQTNIILSLDREFVLDNPSSVVSYLDAEKRYLDNLSLIQEEEQKLNSNIFERMNATLLLSEIEGKTGLPLKEYLNYLVDKLDTPTI